MFEALVGVARNCVGAGFIHFFTEQYVNTATVCTTLPLLNNATHQQLPSSAGHTPPGN